MMSRTYLLTILIWISLVSACSRAHHPLVAPTQAPTMADIYHSIEHQPPSLTSARAQVIEPTTSTPTFVQAYTVPTDFATLPNPLVTVYVYPHLATDEAYPIPGYYTQFPLYTTHMFAKPHEHHPQETAS